MKPTRILFWIGIALITLSGLLTYNLVHAYDATFNFTQQHPELVAGWKIKAGPTKTGPYPHVIDCKKPAPLADGSFDCVGTGLTANPIYAVAVNYNSAGVESPTSNEAAMTITVPPPASLKIGVKITTVSKLNRYGKVIAYTEKKTFESTTPIKEGIRPGYRNKQGNWVSETIIALN